MCNLTIVHQLRFIRHRKWTKNVLLLAVMVFGVFWLPGCGQAVNVPTENTPHEVHTEPAVAPKAPAEPINNPEPETELPEEVSLPQPQADGTGVSFEIPEDWNKYPADALQDLQAMIDEAGNIILYGVLHGFMESQEISAISLADSSVDDYGQWVHITPIRL